MNNFSHYENLAGVVFCGGQSTRMGADKGLLQRNGEYWAEIAAGKLKNLGLPVYYSINSLQKKQYSSIVATSFITDSVDIKGPLGGLLSVYKHLPDKNILILACDMPDIREDTIQKIILEAVNSHFPYESYLYVKEGEPEPLLAIYSSKGLATIYDLYMTGKMHKISMKYMLEQLTTFHITLPAIKNAEFKNYNNKEDLNY